MHSAAFPQVPMQGDWHFPFIQLSVSTHCVSFSQAVRFIGVLTLIQSVNPSPSYPFRHLHWGSPSSTTHTALLAQWIVVQAWTHRPFKHVWSLLPHSKALTQALQLGGFPTYPAKHRQTGPTVDSIHWEFWPHTLIGSRPQYEPSQLWNQSLEWIFVTF